MRLSGSPLPLACSLLSLHRRNVRRKAVFSPELPLSGLEIMFQWLAVLGRLSKGDRLARWELQIRLNVCYATRILNLTLIYFSVAVAFASAVWRSVLAQNKIVRDPLGSDEEVQRAVHHRRGKGFQKSIYNSFAAAIYLFWKERNMRVFQHTASDPSSVCKAVLGDVIVKLCSWTAGVEDLEVHRPE